MYNTKGCVEHSANVCCRMRENSNDTGAGEWETDGKKLDYVNWIESTRTCPVTRSGVS